MKQLTTEEAIALAESKEWESWTDEQIVHFQMGQDKLCMPFSRFHAAMESALGRSVWTHEFADRAGMMAELNGKAPSPSFAEILAKLPADKTIVVVSQ